MSAGLDASTVTPGSTEPDASFTTPAISLCASTSTGNSTRLASTNMNPKADVRITILHPF
jgi:hypothetical protein